MSERADKLLVDLSLDEKVALLAGADLWHVPGVERAGIPRFKMTDGPVGARGAQNTTGPPSACFPCGTALGATWDVDLVRRVGVELGLEVVAKGAHLLLAPTVNLHRSPLAGRNFECYSEDPYLTARMAVAYVDGVQSQGVGCCIKHFVANDSEFERFTISSEVPERALRELYLRPFEVAIGEAAPVAVMSAYNKVDGTWCSEHERLLTAILRDEWGYDGLVVSDWWGTHSTVEAANAGLDVEMPGPTRHRGERLGDAVARGDVNEAILDRSVRRLLLAMERTGAFVRGGFDERADDSPERRAVAREAASAAIVLLRNDGGLLPLSTSDLRKIAVVGPNADALNILGGGSASVSPYYAVTPFEGLLARVAADGVEVVHEPGCSITRYPPPIDLRWVSTPEGEPGVSIEIVDGDDPGGRVIDRLVTRRAVLTWPGSVGRTTPWSARLHATLRVPVTGRYVFQGGSTGRFRISVGGTVVVDGWDETGRGRRVEGGIHLVADEEHDLSAEFAAPPVADPAVAFGGFELRAQAPLAEDAFDRAVEAARASDVAVVVIGTNGDWETEGRDRRTMDLPGQQVELIRAVVAANPRTIVVVNAGSPVTMDWAAEVPAVLQSWFLGQETGNAIADVLVGDVDASGRLPTTIPRRLEDTPAFTNYPGEFGKVHYGEGLFVGYRWYDARDTTPAFPFGHGLSYAAFEYGTITTVDDGAGGMDVSFDLSNTSPVRDGVEVVQLYVRDLEASVARPPKELKAFRKLRLSAGTTTRVRMSLDRSAFAFWDEDEKGWRVEPGAFELLVGSSSRDIRQRAVVTIDA